MGSLVERTFAVGDIHGCYDTLCAAFKELSITDADHVIITGDLVDRGDKIKELLDYLLNRVNTTVLLGNHDYSFVRYLIGDKKKYEFMVPQGLKETLQQLGADAIEYALALSKCPYSYQIEGNNKYIFCHANYPWDQGPWDEMFLWDREGHQPSLTYTKFKNYQGPIIVHGHTPVLKGKPFYEKIGEKIIGINLDMGAYLNVPNSGIRILNVDTDEITEHLNVN